MEKRPSGESGEAEHRATRAPRRWRRVAATAAVLVILAFVVIRIPAVSTPLVNVLASAINPFPGTRLTIDRVSGGFLGGFELRGVRLVRGDGTPMLDVESLQATYSLPALLSRRIEIGRLDIVGAEVHARQQQGGEWDWLAPFAVDSPAVEASPGSRWRVDIGSLRIERSRIQAQASDSMAPPLRVEDLEVRLTDAHLPESAFELDTLGARVFVPELPDSAAHVAFAGSLRDDVLNVRVLRLHSSASDVTGGGVIGLPGLDIKSLRDMDFRLRAAPLDFRDIAPFVPALSSRPSLELDLRAGSAEEWLTVSGQASLDDGATLSLDGGLWLTDGPVHWRMNADLRALDPAHVLRDSIAAGPIDAHLAFDLAGPARDRLSGPAELRVAPLDVGDLELLPSAITATFDDGLARIDGEVGAVSIGRAALSGAIRPFGAMPEFDVRVDLLQGPRDRLDAGVALTDLDATLAVRWTGLQPDSLRADAQLDVNAARLNDLALERGGARLRWEVDSGDARFGATFAGGAVVARADVERLAQGWRAQLHEARVRGLDLAALTGGAATGAVELDMQGVVEGKHEQSLHGELVADLAGTRYAELSIDRSRIDASLRAGRLAATVDVRSNGGDLVAELDARPFDDVPSFDLRELRLAGLDLALLGGPESRIDSRATLRGQGVEPATMRIDGAIMVDSSHIAGAMIDDVRADYALAAGSLRLTTSARALGGDLELAAEARPFDAEPTFTIALDTLHNIDLAGLTGGRAQTALSGAVHVKGTGRTPDSLELEAVANVAGTVNRGRIAEGLVRVSVADRRAELEAGIETLGGEVNVRGNATWADSVPAPVVSARPDSSHSDSDARPPHISDWSIEATSRLPDLGDLAGLPESWAASIEATLSGRGSGATRETLAFDLRSTVSGKLAELRVDSGRIHIAGQDGAAHIGTLLVGANAFSATGAGTVLYGPPRAAAPANADARLGVRLDDAAPLAALLDSTRVLALREATLDARITGPWTAQAFTLTLNANDATVDRVATGTVDVRAEGTFGAGSLDSAGASLRLTAMAAGHVTVDSARVETRYRRGARLPVTLAANVEGGRSVSAAASLDPENLEGGVILEQAEVGLVRETWSLPKPARIAWADALEVDSLFLVSGGRRLGADGRIDPKGEQAFRIQIDSIGVGSFSDLLGFPDLDGWVAGRLRLEGPAAMARLRGVFRGRLGDRTGAMATLRATLASDGEALGVTTSLDDDGGHRMTFSGFMPLRLSFVPDQPVDDVFAQGRFGLTVRADSVSTNWLLPFVRPSGVTQMGGALVADAALNGTAAAPSLRGSVKWVRGSVVMPELGVRYSDVTAGAELGGRGIQLAAQARAGGTAHLEGDIALDELRLGTLAVRGEFDRFHVLSNQLTRFTLSGDMSIDGTTEAPRVTGALRVLDTDFFLDDVAQGAVPSVELTQEDMDMLRDYFGYVPTEEERAQRDMLEPIALDLAVEFGEDVWAHRRVDPRMTLLLAGSLDVRKAAGDSIQLFGTLETVPERSFFRQFRRRFQVTEGAVTFNGTIPTWRVDMGSSYEVPERDATDSQVEITLAVQGGQEDLELTLDSNPSMEAPDIISYLATGRPAASAVAFGEGGGVGETGAALAIGSAAGMLETLGADRIGLDVVEVRQDGARGATFVGGRFLSSRVYVGFQQPVILRQNLEGRTRQETTRVELEYAAYRWLLANVQGGAGTMSVFLRARRAY